MQNTFETSDQGQKKTKQTLKRKSSEADLDILSSTRNTVEEPSQFDDLVDAIVPETKDPHAESLPKMEDQTVQVNKGVPVSFCSTSQQADQYVNQEGTSTICTGLLVPQNTNYASIASKIEIGLFMAPAFETPANLKGKTTEKQKMVSSTATSNENTGTVTMYSAYSNSSKTQDWTGVFNHLRSLVVDIVIKAEGLVRQAEALARETDGLLKAIDEAMLLIPVDAAQVASEP